MGELEEGNSNCLAGMRCPKCGSFGPFYIMGMALFEVHDDGIEECLEPEWEDDSYCRCRKCEFTGTVAQSRTSR